MKFCLITFLFIISLSACSSTQRSGSSLTGHINGEKAGTLIFLEELTYNSRVALDTAELNDDGKFIFNPNVKNRGLYQLRIGEQKAIFLVLDEHASKITVDADSVSIKNFSYKIAGSPPSEQLRKFIVETKQYGEAFGSAMNEYKKSTADSSVSDSTKKIYLTKLMMADSNFRSYARSYIDTVQNPVIAIFAITNLDFQNDRNAFEKLEARLRKENASYPFAQAYYTMMEAQKKPAQQDMSASKFGPGDVAPDIQLQNPSGSVIKLSSLRGKFVLLDFWASWCGPCRRENPNVVASYQKYKNSDFSIYSVSLDTDHDKWVKAIKQDHLEWTAHVSELKGWESAICNQYGIQSIPQSFLLDKEGKIIAMNLRGSELDMKLSQVLK